MTPEQHKMRHQMLHKHFDELLADFICHTNKRISTTTLFELMEWSHEQTKNPTEKPEC